MQMFLQMVFSNFDANQQLVGQPRPLRVLAQPDVKRKTNAWKLQKSNSLNSKHTLLKIILIEIYGTWWTNSSRMNSNNMIYNRFSE